MDAFLSELIGGERPPDLSDRILRNLNRGPRRHNRAPLLFAALAASLLVAMFGFLYARFLHTRGQRELVEGGKVVWSWSGFREELSHYRGDTFEVTDERLNDALITFRAESNGIRGLEFQNVEFQRAK